VALLSEAIDAPFPLLVAGGVPRQIVVYDRIEIGLEVDAFGEAIGGDEDALVELAEGVDPGLAFLRWQRPPDDLHPVVLERGCDGRADRLSGGDEATKDNGREAILQETE